MERYRAFVAKFLSHAFMYPQFDILASMREGLNDLSLSLKVLGIDYDTERLASILKELEREDRLLSLKGEYNRLFATELKAPNWETAYELDKTWRKAYELADIEGFYRAFGLEPKGVEPDSIVAQLEFISLLLLKVDYAREKGLEEMEEVCSKALRDFLKDHTGRWYKLFTELILESTEEDYYKEVAHLLRSFFDTETKNIEGIKDLVEYRRELLEGSTWECGLGPQKLS